MNWTPTPIVRRAVPIRTVGQYVEDETGCRWGSLTIWNGSARCGWCHHTLTIGWLGDRFHGNPEVCSLHIVVDWSAAWIELTIPSYSGVSDPIHQRPKRKRKAS